MTTEEFTGHLMAALHGPQATDIALRVGSLLLDAIDSDGFKAAMAEHAKDHESPAEVLAKALGVTELHSLVFTLSLLALAMNHVDRGDARDQVRAAVANAGTKHTLVTMIRKDLQGSVRPEDFMVDGRLAAVAHLVYPEGGGD